MAARPIKIETTIFDGNKEKSALWFLQTGSAIKVNEHIYDTNEKKIIFVLSHMTKDTAATWAEVIYNLAYSTTIVTPATPNTAAVMGIAGFGTWDAFAAEYKQVFTPVDQKGGSMLKLATWKQKKGTGISAHLATMNTHISRAGVTQDAVKMAFVTASLDPEFRVALFTSGLHTAGNYTDFCDNLLQQENNLVNLRVYQSQGNRFRQNSSYSGGNRYSAPSSSSRDPNAMEVDATEIRLKKLTPEERERLRKNGGCFSCRKLGHMSFQCPNKNQTPARAIKPSVKATETSHIDNLPDEEDTPMDACRIQLEDF